VEDLPSSIPLVSSHSYGKSSFCLCKETIFGIISIARAARVSLLGDTHLQGAYIDFDSGFFF
jgi:hypothetical protein